MTPASTLTRTDGRTFRPQLPPHETGIASVDKAIATHRAQLQKMRECVQAIEQTERTMRSAAATDLRARSAAELAGKKDPGPAETVRLKAELEKLQDRRGVLAQAVEDSAVAIAVLVEEQRAELLGSTADELEISRRAYTSALAEVATLYDRVTHQQALRGWLAGFPGRGYRVQAGHIVECASSFEEILAGLHDRATVDLFPALPSKPELVSWVATKEGLEVEA